MVIKALDRKLLRDLRRLRTQAVAIALVAASGVALFVATATTYRSLRLSQSRYYEGWRFAHVWVRLARAPDRILGDLAALPGVTAVEGRVVSEAILDVPGVEEPATGLLVSIPPGARHSLNDLYVRRGRHVEPGRPDEVLVSEAFAEKNGLQPGATLFATAARRRVALHIVGVALSPEHVMQMPPGGVVPDDRRFGVFWMARDQLETLLDMRGAVNDVALRVSSPAFEAPVIDAVDRILEPYGGRGAYGRRSQPSHMMLEDHIVQLKGLALIVPLIFLAVTAFLMNVVLSRLIGTQRAQVGMLKAFGYSHLRVTTHYLEMALVIVMVGIVAGLPVGVWLGRIMAVFYASFFRFPVLVFRLEPAVATVGAAVTMLAAASGALGALRRVATLPPIVAMSPAAPVYRPTPLDRFLPRWLGPAARMIGRNVTRWPARALLTTAGMALAVALLVLGEASVDSINRMIAVRFHTAQREDVSVLLSHARSLEMWRDFAALPGVRRAEPYRSSPGRIHAYGRAQDVAIYGLAQSSVLRRVVDTRFMVISPAAEGSVISSWLATRFGIRRGEPLAIEIREGRRRVVTVRVVGMVDEPLGASVYMDLQALGRLLDQPQTFSAVNLLLDPARQSELYATLKRAPEVLAVELRRRALANFRAMSDDSLRFVRRVVVLFSAIIAFGVVYNAARIAVAERAYELATLRVLGFTRGEISSVLLGEIGVLAVSALPLGFGGGYALFAVVAKAMSSERFRMPLVIEPRTYAFALIVFTAAALASALLVRGRLDRLDLVEVLKARE
ncbi:MAG TPA: ABC transporter permease [Gemmatimonadales bacterium]|nr:ABC transporter permease [Gemmatimonadales bacterium]